MKPQLPGIIPVLILINLFGSMVLIGDCGGGDDETSPASNLTPSSGSGGSNTTGTTTNAPVKYQLVHAEEDYNGDGSIDSVYNYVSDTNGNLTRWEFYGNSGELKYVATFTYDLNKRLLKEAWDSTTYFGNQKISPDGVIDGVVEYTYDSHGNLMQRYTYNEFFTGTSSYINKYNTEGQLLQQSIDLQNDGVIDWTDHYAYDANGKLVKQESETVSTIYSYDVKGNLTSMKRVYSDNSPIYTETYIYNTDGKMEKYQRSGGVSDVENYSFIYAYDNNGNVVEEKMYGGSGELSAVTHYSWQSGDGYTNFHAATDPCLLVSRFNSPEERLFDSVFSK